MSWKYILTKKVVDDEMVYGIAEAFMNGDGSIWGVSGHVDPFIGLQEDNIQSDLSARQHMYSIIRNLLHDCVEVINLDTFEYADPEFKDDLEQVKRDLNEAS